MTRNRFFYLLEGLPESTRIQVEGTVAYFERRNLLKDANWEGYFYALLEGEVMFDMLSTLLDEEALWKAYRTVMVKQAQTLVS